MAIDSFVLGILSLYVSGIPGIICGAIGLSKSKKALAENPDLGFARAGRICSIVGIVYSIILTLTLSLVFIAYSAIIGLAVISAVGY